MTSEGIIRLKEAGFSDQTVQVIIAERAITTAAFTVQDFLDMKKAGICEKTIRMLIHENSFLKNRIPIVYGKDIRSIRFTSAEDIIALKKAGFSDQVIQAIITVAGDRNEIEREEALDLLREMNIRIDLRGQNEPAR